MKVLDAARELLKTIDSLRIEGLTKDYPYFISKSPNLGVVEFIDMVSNLSNEIQELDDKHGSEVVV